jgi:hypothetical protein
VLDFDGVNDSVITGNLAKTTSHATICGWIKRNGTISPNAGFIVSRSEGNIGLVESAGDTDTVTGTWNNTGSEWGNPGLSLTDNQWHFIAMVVSGPTLTIYRDESFFSISITATARTLGVFNIGNDPGASNRFFRGCMDDIRIYNRALSPNEIRLLATRPGIAYEMAPRRWSAAMIEAYDAAHNTHN